MAPLQEASPKRRFTFHAGQDALEASSTGPTYPTPETRFPTTGRASPPAPQLIGGQEVKQLQRSDHTND